MNATNNNEPATIAMQIAPMPVPVIERKDFIAAGIRLCTTHAMMQQARELSKDASKIGSAYLFQELKAGKGGEYFANLRESVYVAAREAGYTVNTRSNTVGVLTSNAATIADSPHRDEILRESENFAQAVKLSKESKKAAKDAEERAKLEDEANKLLASLSAEDREDMARAAYDRALATFRASLAEIESSYGVTYDVSLG